MTDFLSTTDRQTSNSYTMGCPPVRGDNSRDLASGLSYVQVDKHGIAILYHLHECKPCTSRQLSWHKLHILGKHLKKADNHRPCSETPFPGG